MTARAWSFTVLIMSSVLNVAGQTAPPVAKRISKEITIHGDTRVDNYFWLRDRSNPDVISYLESENAYTDS